MRVFDGNNTAAADAYYSELGGNSARDEGSYLFQYNTNTKQISL